MGNSIFFEDVGANLIVAAQLLDALDKIQSAVGVSVA
jgi:hypothetical protein